MALDLALVNLPFAAVTMPSVQLGVLHAAAAEAGFNVRTFHLNLELLRFLDARSDEEQRARNLQFLVEAESRMSGIHKYAVTTAPLFDERTSPWPAPAPGDYEPVQIETASFIRRVFPEFIDHCAALLLEHEPAAVGLSCTFERLPQMQLAKRLKELRPSIWTVFGGTYVEGVMGEALCRAFSFVDIVVRGEGEGALVNILQDLRSGQHRDYPGLVWRRRSAPVIPTPAKQERLVTLRLRSASKAPPPEAPAEPQVVAEEAPAYGRQVSPIPDYDDYSEQVAKTTVPLNREIVLPIETSRGCWWYKKKCLFCGRSESNLRFRVKARDKMIEEINYLSERHQTLRFMAVDPAILEKDLAHISDEAATIGYDYRLWCQGRVFTDRDTHRKIARVVHTMFFGIESLSTPVLKLMRKGHTAVQALTALKRASEYGVRLTHNMIHGFPGEIEDHYLRLNDWMPAFFHLPPPFQLGPMGIDRASVYFDQPADYGITLHPPVTNEDPVLHLAQARGVTDDLLMDLAASVPADIPCVTGPVIDRTYELVAAWKNGYGANAQQLWWQRGPKFLVIHDRRHGGANKLELPAPLDELYLATDEGATVPEIEEHLAKAGATVAREDIERFLAELVAERVMYEEDGVYLSLALKARAAAA